MTRNTPSCIAIVIACGLSPSAGADQAKMSRTASGIGYSILKEGSGAKPKLTDTVRVHYRGALPDGQEFDSSYKRGKPAAFPLTRVIPCWMEGLQLMREGGKATLECPPALAYGNQNVPGIPAGSTLIFDVELLGIVR